MVKPFRVATPTFVNNIILTVPKLGTLNQKWVSSDMWESFYYLTGAVNGISGISEIIVCLFFPHRLQLEMKQRTSLAAP